MSALSILPADQVEGATRWTHHPASSPEEDAKETTILHKIAKARKALCEAMDEAGKLGYAVKAEIAPAYNAHGPRVPEHFSASFDIAIFRPIGAIG